MSKELTTEMAPEPTAGARWRTLAVISCARQQRGWSNGISRNMQKCMLPYYINSMVGDMAVMPNTDYTASLRDLISLPIFKNAGGSSRKKSRGEEGGES